MAGAAKTRAVILIIILLISALLLIIGSFLGGFQFAKEKAPNTVDFSYAEKFMEILDQKLNKMPWKMSYGWGYNIETTFSGPVLSIRSDHYPDINSHKKYVFQKNIIIRSEIIDKVLSRSQEGYTYDEDMTKIYPLAEEVVQEIWKLYHQH